MKFQVSELVVTPANEKAATRIISVTQPHEKAEFLYLSGPAGSGKSVFLEARGTEKDLLSSKRALYCHAGEILAMLAIDNENADNFLSRIGEVDVLFIDDVEDFLNDEALGAQACRLLVESRMKRGLDTVVASRVPFSQLDVRLKDVFSGFEELTFVPLDEDGSIALAKAYATHFSHARGADKLNELSEDAFAFIGRRYKDSLHDMAPAMEYLVTVAEFPSGALVDAALAEEALSV